jgi:hypothetical protein
MGDADLARSHHGALHDAMVCAGAVFDGGPIRNPIWPLGANRVMLGAAGTAAAAPRAGMALPRAGALRSSRPWMPSP